MRTRILLVLFFFLSFLTGAKAQNQDVANLQTEIQQLRIEIEQLKGRVQELELSQASQSIVEETLPCADAAKDTDTHYMEFATGEGMTEIQALQNAENMAANQLAKRVFGSNPLEDQRNIISSNVGTWCRKVSRT